MNQAVVVIIPALNAAHQIHRQLSALDAQDDLDFRVVVADNGSTDNTVDVCRAWEPRFNKITIVDASRQRGVAYARNAAIDKTDEPLILICDADDAVSPTWVRAMRAGLATADGVTSPLNVHYPDRPNWDTVWNSSDVPVSMRFLPYLPGCSMGLRRSLVESVGGFDTELWRGQEDVDFGWRASLNGARLSVVPEAAVTYYQRCGLRSRAQQQLRYGRAHVELFAKHRLTPGAPAAASYRASVRWFWHWARQFPSAIKAHRAGLSLGGACFQLGRLFQSLLSGVRSPL